MKKYFVYSLVFLLVSLVGCENVGPDMSQIEFLDSDIDADIVEVGIITDESRKEEIAAQIEAGSLNVENDTFEFENLTSFIGKPDSELASLIGSESHPEAFETKLFGEEVFITTIVEAENVKQIEILFPDTDGTLLENAIGEQVGIDPDETEGILRWDYLGKTITQQNTEDGFLVKITV